MKEKISLMTFPMDIDVAMRKMSNKDIFNITKEAGIKYVDVMGLSNDKLKEYVDASNVTNVKTYCYIDSVSFFSQKENEILKAFKNHIAVAKSLGAKLYMIVPLNIQKDKKVCAKLGKSKVQELLIKYFKMAVKLGNDAGIKVCFETTPQDYACLSGIDDCKYILDNVEGLGLVYDTANMLPHGDDPLDYYNKLKSYIVHVHLKDVKLVKPTLKDKLFHAEKTKDGQVMKCCLTGEGIIPLKEIIKEMKRDNYQGYYALEYSHPDAYPSNKEQHKERLKSHLNFFNSID